MSRDVRKYSADNPNIFVYKPITHAIAVSIADAPPPILIDSSNGLEPSFLFVTSTIVSPQDL